MRTIEFAATKYQTRQEAVDVAEKTGQTAIFLNGRSVVVPETTIQQLLAKRASFAFLSSHDGIIATVPMN